VQPDGTTLLVDTGTELSVEDVVPTDKPPDDPPVLAVESDPPTPPPPPPIAKKILLEDSDISEFPPSTPVL
jgi:hypothetical protein